MQQHSNLLFHESSAVPKQSSSDFIFMVNIRISITEMNMTVAQKVASLLRFDFKI